MKAALPTTKMVLSLRCICINLISSYWITHRWNISLQEYFDFWYFKLITGTWVGDNNACALSQKPRLTVFFFFLFFSASHQNSAHSRTETHSSDHSLLAAPPRAAHSIKSAVDTGFRAHLISITCTDITHLLTDENNDSTCRHMPNIPRLRGGKKPDGFAGLVVACVIPEACERARVLRVS